MNRGCQNSPLSQPVVQGLAHAQASSVSSSTGNSMVTGACCWGFWIALMGLEVQLRNGTGSLQLSPMHPAVIFSLSSSLLWFTCVTMHKQLNKQHLTAIFAAVMPGKPYYRAGPLCVEYPAHSEEKYASCITGRKLSSKTVYFSLNKNLKGQTAESCACCCRNKGVIALMHLAEHNTQEFLPLYCCLIMFSTPMR